MYTLEHMTPENFVVKYEHYIHKEKTHYDSCVSHQIEEYGYFFVNGHDGGDSMEAVMMRSLVLKYIQIYASYIEEEKTHYESCVPEQIEEHADIV